MSRTRELEMFLNPKELDNLDNCKFGGLTLVSRDGYNYLKVKLIIELPERKVTISEDDIDKAFNSIRYLERHEDSLCPYTVRWLKDALFKDAE